MPDDLSAAFAQQRQTMVDCQVRTFDVTDQALLSRLGHVPREMFLPDGLRPLAYSDAPLTLRAGGVTRMLLVPMLLARMIQGLDLAPGDAVLDVGGASGYSAAVLAGLAGQVTALESSEEFSAAARSNFAAGGVRNATAQTGPLAAGWTAAAPFDAILVNGAVSRGLDELFAQLSEGGRLVCVEASPGAASAFQAVRYQKNSGETGRRPLFPATAGLLPEFSVTPGFSF